MRAFGLEHALKQQEIRNKEQSLENAKALSEIQKKENKQKEDGLLQEQKRVELINKDIDFWIKEKEKVEIQINEIKQPISININTDMIGASKEYHDIRNDVDELKVDLDKSSKNTTSISSIGVLEFSLSILIVFVLTRITGDNSDFAKTVGAFEIVQYFYPTLSAESAFNINLFLQDTLFIGALAKGMGALLSRFEWFKSKAAMLYMLLIVILSMSGMQIANILFNM
jgi:hypothetical protein